MVVSHGEDLTKVSDLALDAVLYLYLAHQLKGLQNDLLTYCMIQGHPLPFPGDDQQIYDQRR